MQSSVRAELPDVIERGRALLTVRALAQGAPKGEISYVRLCPANHHSEMFDAVYSPASSDKDTLDAEITGTHPLCSLCHMSRISECPGHRIAIRLPFLMVQPQFAEIFVKFLNAICLNYRRPPAQPFYGCGAARTQVIKRGATVVAGMNSTASDCKRCKASRPGGVKVMKFVAGAHGGIAYSIGKEEHQISLSALMQYISASPVREAVLGAASFYGMHIDIRTMVTDKLYLPPYQLRPSVAKGGNVDTAHYANISDQCSKVPYPSPMKLDSANMASSDVMSKYALIYREILELMAQKPKSPDKITLWLGLPGKKGHIRGHVTGAHANGVLRAVIRPSGSNFGEFEISRHFQSLTTKVGVNRHNIDEIRQFADAGLLNFIQLRKSAEVVHYRRGTQIHLGDVVWRNIVPGDVIVANRQPTLHRLSLMANTVRMIDGPVNGLHSSETTPYNGDFDGDEMNAIVPPDYAGTLELRSVAHAVNNVMGPGAPAMAPVFHDLAVMMLLSIRAVEKVRSPSEYLAAYTPSFDLDRRKASYPARRSAAIAAGLLPARGDDELLTTYGDALSLLFPEDFNFEKGKLQIWNGVFIRGEFEKKNLGMSTGTITHAFGAYPRKRAALFINDVNRLCGAYMHANAISFDPSDMIHPDEYYAEIRTIVNSTRQQLEAALQQKARAPSEIERGQLERRIVMLAAAPVQQIRQSISDASTAGTRAIAKMRADGASADAIAAKEAEVRAERRRNVFELMFMSGCRGSLNNAMQMTLTLGAQYTGTQRTDASQMSWIRNPHAAPAADGRRREDILGNGVIDSNYMGGLTPEHYAVGASPVRHQIVKSKLEVATVGYLAKLMGLAVGQYYCADDMAIVAGRTVIADSMGGHLDPMSLVKTSVDGHGHFTFANIPVLVGKVNYAARVAAQ